MLTTPSGAMFSNCAFFVQRALYIWSKNFSHLANEKSGAKMAEIDVQSLK
jgi:hypothetical protein